MSRADEFHRERLFHGSDREFSQGDTIKPRHGSPFAYATFDRETAQSYGEHLHEVHPAHDMEHDPDLQNEPGKDFRSRTGFRVLRVVE